MHGRVPAKAEKIGTPDVLLVERGIADVDEIEREFLGKPCVVSDNC